MSTEVGSRNERVADRPVDRGLPVFEYRSVDGEARSLHSWYALRTALYLESGLIEETDLDDRGLYLDRYDEFSEHVLLYDEAAPTMAIGTCRIIDGRRTPLQVAHQFGVRHSPHALEVSGFAVLAVYRKTFATLGCYWLLYHRSVAGGYDEVHFEVEVPLRDALMELGLPVRQTAPERFVYNAVNVPLMVSPREAVEDLREADQRRSGATRFAELFLRPFDGRLDTAELFGTAVPTVRSE